MEAVEPGTIVGGFRVERSLERGTLGQVFEAIQVSLDRTVALRLIEGEVTAASGFSDQQQRAAAFHHPNAVPTYEAGDWRGASFAATRFVRGTTLADALDAGELSRAAGEDIVAGISEALEAAHRAGLVHGAVSARNVLIDGGGNSFLSDLGLGRPGSVEGDVAALAELRSRVQERTRGGISGRARALGAGVALVAAGALALALFDPLGDEQGAEEDVAPAPAEGSLALGSDLAPGPAEELACEDDPGPNTQLCTLIEGSRANKSGVVRSWHVRGASGDLALQVIGTRDGKPFLRGFTGTEAATGPGVHGFDSNLRIERGDTIGLVLSPGASVGVRGSGGPIIRWDGTPPRLPRAIAGRRIEGEMLLRADIVPGVRPEISEITGAEAARAPAGTILGSSTVATSSGSATIEVVRVEGEIAIDLRRGRLRRARLTVTDADADGELISLKADCGFAQDVCFRWSNGAAESDQIFHAYRIGAAGLRPIG